MNVNEVATIVGISVRTLHHYDKLGLLSPQRNGENNYRYYSEADLDKLQQILFFKECGFSLKKIQALLSSPDFNKAEAFSLQEKYLLHEKKRIETMLNTLHNTMKASRGEVEMSQKEKFEGLDFSQNPYGEEARQRWGHNATAHMNSLQESEQKVFIASMHTLFEEFALLRHEAPEAEIVQQAMAKFYAYLNENIGHQYSLQAFGQLGQMYVTDARFQQNIDAYGDGLASFLAKAMQVFAND